MNPAQVAAVEALALAEAESRAADAAAKVARAEWLRTPEGRAWTAAANQQDWERESGSVRNLEFAAGILWPITVDDADPSAL